MTAYQAHVIDAIAKAEASGYRAFAEGLRQLLRRSFCEDGAAHMIVPHPVSTPIQRISPEVMDECRQVSSASQPIQL